MKKTLLIAKKEWWGYLQNPAGYVFVGLLTVISGWMFFNDLFVLGQADLTPYWATIGFLYSIFVPALSMGAIAEEKKNGNWEVLLSLPIEERQLVWGKWLGLGGYLSTTMLFCLPAVVTVMMLGKPEMGLIVSSIIGLILLGGAYLATGIAASSISNQPMAAFLLSSVILIINNLMGQEVLLSRVGTTMREWLSGLSLNSRIAGLGAGVLTVNDVVFVGSWVAVFLIVSELALKTRDK